MTAPGTGLDTDDLVGLDIDGPAESGLVIGGWSLLRFDGGTVHRYDAALSHVTAQYGHGVKMAVGSHDLEYVVDEDGRVHPQYGPYHVDRAESHRWAADAALLGDLIHRVFAEDTKRVRRFKEAARKFLRISSDLYGGMSPEPRLPLEMSTALELLLLTESRELDISERVRRGAAALAAGGLGEDQAVREFAGAVYDAGSRYRHGGDEYRLTWGAASSGTASRKTLDVERAYRFLHRLLLHGLAVVSEGDSPAVLCDRDQRDTSTAERGERARVRIRGAAGRLRDQLGPRA